MKSLIILLCALLWFVLTANAQVVVDAKNSGVTVPGKAGATTLKSNTAPVKTGATTLKSNTSPVKTVATPGKVATATPAATSTPVKKKGNKFDADRSITKANNSVNKANTTANNATDLLSTTADKAKALANKVGALVPKKAKKATVSGAENNTEISIKGLNFATLTKLNENIQGCPGVQSTEMKFNGSKSTITVNHNGTTANLLKQIEMKSKDIFTDENINDFKEGKVSIKVKK
ncbi:MAG: hypothetical protein ACXVJN_06550 [Mucilaginibacter sp.]